MTQDGSLIIDIIKKSNNLTQKQLNLSNNITILDISGKNLIGSLNFTNLKKLDCSFNYLAFLNLTNCPNLTEINCSDNQLIDLDLSNNQRLTKLFASNNQLTNLVFLTKINSQQLIALYLISNNLSSDSLKYLDFLPNLENLWIGSNPLNDSLQPFQVLTQLKQAEEITVSSFTTQRIDQIYPFEVLINNNSENGLDEPSKVNTSLIFSLNKDLRLIKRLGKINKEKY